MKRGSGDRDVTSTWIRNHW